MRKRSQLTVEFMFIFAMAFLIFLVLVTIIIQFVDSSRTNMQQDRFDSFAEGIQKNFQLAKDSGTGFAVTMVLPQKIGGYDYTISNEPDVVYIQDQQTGILAYRIIPNSTGTLQKGCNRITKEKGVIKIEAC